MSLNIVLLGPQGAGKGTQAKRISDEYGIPQVATGDMFRAAIAAETELGRAVKPFVESGQLVPDELTVALIRARLDEPDTGEGFILDGFPRNAVQAEALDEMLVEIGRPISIVFEFQLPEAIAIERILGRAVAEGRTDDQDPEAIRTRLALYREKTEPLAEYYRLAGILVGIHAERSVNEVFSEIQEALEQVAVR